MIYNFNPILTDKTYISTPTIFFIFFNIFLDFLFCFITVKCENSNITKISERINTCLVLYLIAFMSSSSLLINLIN